MSEWISQYRVTDGHSHAETFRASDARAFRTRLALAIAAFRAARPRHIGRLHLHVWDGDDWAPARWRPRLAIVHVDEGVLMRDHRRLWAGAAESLREAQSMNCQISGLVTWLRAGLVASPGRHLSLVRTHDE